jgi:hypothetical protein
MIVCVAELPSHDVVTATQVIYSASSVVERIVGPFLVTEKIYRVLKNIQECDIPFS